jgi:hypothetical protein
MKQALSTRYVPSPFLSPAFILFLVILLFKRLLSCDQCNVCQVSLTEIVLSQLRPPAEGVSVGGFPSP